MELSTSSFSNEIDKSIKEDFSVSQAAIDEIKLRKEKGEKPESISNEEIKKNDPILDTYKVLDDAIHGGMGSVWRVHHESWNTDLAMKRPQPRFFAEGSEARKEEFIRECENWINLGLHPNIVSCYYVREIGGVPTIFSEWMDNGSLKDRIKDGSLYEGTEEEVQERILDIAIQTARGLQYSHENNLIHQDVKPGNILLTKDWDAKVADFGLAKAQSQLTENKKPVSTGYTIQYCPREQAEGMPAEKWMDVYAWALTVLEMYAGKRLWETGTNAFPFLFGEMAIQQEEDYRIDPPQKLLDAYEEDYNPNFGSWRDFSAMEQLLLEIWHDQFGSDYPRPASKAAADTAGTLNNRALSFLDLGLPEKAKTCWKDALSVSPESQESQINYLLFQWRQGYLTDSKLFQKIDILEEQYHQEEYKIARAELFIESVQLSEARSEAEKLENEREKGRLFRTIDSITESKRISLVRSKYCDNVFRLSETEAAALASGRLYIYCNDNYATNSGSKIDKQLASFILTYPEDTAWNFENRAFFDYSEGEAGTYEVMEYISKNELTKALVKREDALFLLDTVTGSETKISSPPFRKMVNIGQSYPPPGAITGRDESGNDTIQFQLAEIIGMACDEGGAHIIARYDSPYEFDEPSEWDYNYNLYPRTIDFCYDTETGELKSDTELKDSRIRRVEIHDEDYQNWIKRIKEDHPYIFELLAPDSGCLKYSCEMKRWRLNKEGLTKAENPSSRIESRYVCYTPKNLWKVPWRLCTIYTTAAAMEQLHRAQETEKAFIKNVHDGNWSAAISCYNVYGEIPGFAFSDEEGKMEDILAGHCKRVGIKNLSACDIAMNTKADSVFIQPTPEAIDFARSIKPPVLGRFYKINRHLYTVIRHEVLLMFIDKKTALIKIHLQPVLNGTTGAAVYQMVYLPQRKVLYTIESDEISHKNTEDIARNVTMTPDEKYLFAQMKNGQDRIYHMDTFLYDEYAFFNTGTSGYRSYKYSDCLITPDSAFMFVKTAPDDSFDCLINLKTKEKTDMPKMFPKAFSENGRYFLQRSDKGIKAFYRIRWNYAVD